MTTLSRFLRCASLSLMLLALTQSLSALPTTVKGKALRDVWTNVAGTQVSDFTYDTRPAVTDHVTSLQGVDWSGGSGTSNLGDNYAQRIMGFIEAPSSGTYTFWIASGGASELWISTDAEVYKKVKVATVPDSTNVGEWNKYSSQKTTVTFEANRLYYIEILHKAGAGSDHVAVGWSQPGQSTSAPVEIVPGSVIHPRPRLDMGANINNINYYSDLWFVNLMWHADRWRVTGYNYEDLPLDVNGYPLQVPVTMPDSGTINKFETPVTNRGDENSEWVMLWDGTGNVRVTGRGQSISNTSNRRVFRLTGTPGGGNFLWAVIDSSDVNDHVRNIRILPLDRENNWQDNPWNMEKVNAFAAYSTLRFMGMGATNGHGATTWESRKTPTYYTMIGEDWSDGSHGGGTKRVHFGPSYELMIDLCNRLDANMWICIPHKVDDNYMTQMARLVRDNLNDNLTCYVEYSNEVWNWGFSQSSWNVDNTPKEESSDNFPEQYAYHVKRVIETWDPVWSATGERDRLTIVAGVQKNWVDVAQRVTARVVDYYGLELDAVSPSGYFGLNDSARSTLAAIGASATADDVMDQVSVVRDTNEAADWNEIIEHAQARGVTSFPVYEGGQHLTDYVTYSYSPALAEAKYDIRMYEEYIKNFNHLQETGCGVFCNLMPFGDIDEPGGFGHFLSMDSYLNDYYNPMNNRGRAVFDCIIPKWREASANSIYLTWIGGYGLDIAGQGAQTVDADSDGMSNLVEFAFNMDPTANDNATLAPSSGTYGLPRFYYDEATGKLRVELVRRKDASLTYTVQESTDLSAWNTCTTASLNSADIDTTWERIELSCGNAIGAGEKRFLRLLITEN